MIFMLLLITSSQAMAGGDIMPECVPLTLLKRLFIITGCNYTWGCAYSNGFAAELMA